MVPLGENDRAEPQSRRPAPRHEGGRTRSLGMTLIGTAVVGVLLAVAPVASAQGPNKCLAGKNKCASKKAQGILKCWIKAEKDGVPVDQACVDKARGKFDG